MRMRGWLVVGVLVLSGCGGGSPGGGASPAAGVVDAAPSSPASSAPMRSACDVAVGEAAAVAAGEDQLEDLWPAFDACGSVAELAEADAVHPDALDGADPVVYVDTQCAYEPAVAGSALCVSRQ